jgi:hypothetical protein
MLLFSTLGASFFHTSAGKLSAQMRIYQPQVAKGLPFFGQLVVGKLAWKSQSKTMGGTDRVPFIGKLTWKLRGKLT